MARSGARDPHAAAAFPRVVLGATRAIGLRHWVWTTGIALLLALANSVGVLPALLSMVPRLIGPQDPGWSIAKSVGTTAAFVAAAYCLLVAVRVAEHGIRRGQVPVRRYVVAGLGACAAALMIEIALFVLVPSFAPNIGGRALLVEPQQLLGRLAWSTGTLVLTGALALAVYVRLSSARRAREAFNAAELERVAASREVLASRLAAMQAQIEPRFLLSTLAQIEALYERDPHAGDRMLDALIAYLRAVLPQLRSQRSTLGREVRLAESYLAIMRIRLGSRLDVRVDVDPGLADCDFPPMVLLPLIDDALRNGLEPMPLGGTIRISANVGGDRVRVKVTDDGLPRPMQATTGVAIATLRERLRGLYGTSASLDVIANAEQGVTAAIEVPHADARAHR